MALLLNRGGTSLLEVGRGSAATGVTATTVFLLAAATRMGQTCTDIRSLPVFHYQFKLSGVTQVQRVEVG